MKRELATKKFEWQWMPNPHGFISNSIETKRSEILVCEVESFSKIEDRDNTLIDRIGKYAGFTLRTSGT